MMTVEKALSLLYEMRRIVAVDMSVCGMEFPKDWDEAINLISNVLSNPGNYFFETIYLNKQKANEALSK